MIVSYQEKDIVYERGDYWVLMVPSKKHFEVYKTGITHSTRCAVIGYHGPKGLALAIKECNKRAA